MLDLPTHIARADIAATPLSYAWDEWNVKAYYWDVSQALFDRLDKLSDTACTGLAIACGEWVLHRFDAHNSDTAPFDFLEAAWASLVHPAYCIYTETVDDEWRGPVRGPLAVTIAIVNDAIFCRDQDPEVATRACWMQRLARHLLADAAAFDAWFEQCVARLERCHPRALVHAGLFDVRFWNGDPVPRLAFEPSRAYTPAQSPALLDAFLRTRDPVANPYLRTQAELADIDEFEDTPYQYVR